MSTSRNNEAVVTPSLESTIAELFNIVDEELALIPNVGSTFTPATAKEADGTVLGIVYGSTNGRSRARYASVATFNAVSTIVTRISIADDCPRIIVIVGPSSRNLAVLKVKELVAVGMFGSNRLSPADYAFMYRRFVRSCHANGGEQKHHQ